MKDSSLFDLPSLKKEGFKAESLLAVDPQIREKFFLHLEKTKVKRDVVTRNMVLNTGMSAYSKNPINLFLRGENSIGKTYNVTQVLSYFPRENVWMLGGLTPKALIHDYGTLTDEKGEEIDFSEKPDENASKEEQLRWRKRLEHSKYIIDLRGKTLVFLEPPYFETYNMLRPILSHDKEEISYKFSDKTQSGRLRTTHVVLRGWPACIFCSTEEKYIKDLASRGFSVTPETTAEKFKDANVLTGEKKAFPWAFREDFDFVLLQGYISWLKDKLQNLNVCIPFCQELAKHYPSEYPRSMRDFRHFADLMEISALFYCMQRPILEIQCEKSIISAKEGGETVTEKECFILATAEDFKYVSDLWSSIEETTVTGLPGHILKFFHEAVEPLSEQIGAFHYDDLAHKYNEKAVEKKSSETIRRWISYLSDIGWVDTVPDPDDKRKVLVTMIKKPENFHNSPQFKFVDIFSLELFKGWLEKTKEISTHNKISLKESFLATEPSSLEAIYEKYFTCKASVCGYSSKPEIRFEIESKPKSIHNSEMCLNVDNSKPLTIQEVEVLVRSSFKKGIAENFVSEAIRIGNLTRKEADALFDRLVDEGYLGWFDENGVTVWSWIR